MVRLSIKVLLLVEIQLEVTKTLQQERQGNPPKNWCNKMEFKLSILVGKTDWQACRGLGRFIKMANLLKMQLRIYLDPVLLQLKQVAKALVDQHRSLCTIVSLCKQQGWVDSILLIPKLTMDLWFLRFPIKVALHLFLLQLTI